MFTNALYHLFACRWCCRWLLFLVLLRVSMSMLFMSCSALFMLPKTSAGLCGAMAADQSPAGSCTRRRSSSMCTCTTMQ